MSRRTTHGVTATFIRRDGSDETVTARGDVLIAADGIHSTVRRTFYPDEGRAHLERHHALARSR